MCCFHPFLDDSNRIGGCLDQVGSYGKGLIDVLLTEGALGLSSIQSLTQGHPYTGVVAIVVGEFNEYHILVPSLRYV